MEESIRVVKDFDKTLKYVTFTIHKDVDVGLANPQTDDASTSCRESALTSAREKKAPKLRDKTANFTGNKKLFPLVGSFRTKGIFSHLLFKIAFPP
jgi:hypothetical protein